MISLPILYSASFCNNKWSVLPLQAILWNTSPSPWLRNLFQMLYYCFFITHSELLNKIWGYAFINIICALQNFPPANNNAVQLSVYFFKTDKRVCIKVFILQFSYLVDWKGASYWRTNHPKQGSLLLLPFEFSLLCKASASWWVKIEVRGIRIHQAIK